MRNRKKSINEYLTEVDNQKGIRINYYYYVVVVLLSLLLLLLTRGIKVNCEKRAISGAFGLFRWFFIVSRHISVPIANMTSATC